MRKSFLLAAVCLITGSLFLGTGCTMQKQLKVGLVDTERIVSSNPEYMELNMILMKEREELFSQIPRNASALSADEQNKLREKVSKEANERSQKFDKLYRDFIKKMRTDVQEAAKEVADQKGIDLVVINTPRVQTAYYYYGENITTDILLKQKK